MWNRVADNLGNVQAGNHYPVVFSFNGDITIDTTTFEHCGCISLSWNPTTKIMNMNYTPKPVPQHLRVELRRTNYPDIKNVTFMAIVNGVRKQHQLSIIATVFDNLPK